MTDRILILTINPGLAIVGVLPTGQPGVAYHATLRGRGGLEPYTWDIVAGSLPAGLSYSIDSSGDFVVSGTTSLVGSFDFTLLIRDSQGRSRTKQFALQIQAEPLTISGSAPAGQVGVPYSFTYAVGGGLPSYTFSISSGALPAGLSLNASTGEISGTPTTGESASFRVRVTDSQSPPAMTDLDDSISVAYATLAVGGAWTGVDMGQPLGGSPRAITGGLAPYSVDALPISGTRPAGVTISVSGSNLVATGNTTTAATYTWTDRVRSADGQYADVVNSIVIADIAYPDHVATYTYVSAGSFVTSHTINVTGSAAGDLLILFVGGSSSANFTAPAGWTAHGKSSSTGIGGSLFSRVLPSAITSVTLTSGSTSATINAVRIAAGTFDAATAIQQARSTATVTTNHPLPSLSPTWGAGRTLWIAGICLSSGGTRGISACPLSDMQVVTTQTISGGSVSDTASCSEGVSASSLPAAAFASNYTQSSVCMTVAVKPA